MTRPGDLFEFLTPPCKGCPNLGALLDSGVGYCWGDLTWRGPDERVEGCVYRGRTVARFEPQGTRIEALRDLLTSPRHDINQKGREWLRAELRAEEKRRSA